MVVISTISVLMAILMPALARARLQGKSIVCRSNLRQLFLANSGYATENDGYLVAAAPDIISALGGKRRWHGVRSDANEPFDPLKGPLAGYLADGKVKECPVKVKFRKGAAWGLNFEQGCGGYGYNMTYIGSRVWQKGLGFAERYSLTARLSEVKRPSETLMFADCAMARLDDNGQPYLHEYSFAEPPYFVIAGQMITSMYSSPSIHFRHQGLANIAWSDGHVDARELAESGGINNYGANSEEFLLGWFEPVDNTPFDLE